MMVWMSRELISSMDVIWYDGFGSEVWQFKADFCHVPTTNLTQHDS
jgi:hypothetical protein